MNNDIVNSLTLGQLMLAGAKNQDEYSAPWLGYSSEALWHGHRADGFININQYLTTNGLQKVDDVGQNNPRPAAKYFGPVSATPTKEGVAKVLTVGAPDNH